MLRITRDQSSGSSKQCLAKITVMVLSRPLIWTRENNYCNVYLCVLHSASLDCAVHTQCLSRLCSIHTVPL